MGRQRSGAEDEPTDRIAACLVLQYEVADAGRHTVALPVAFGTTGRNVLPGGSASGFDRVGRRPEIVLGDVSDAGCLARRIGGEPGGSTQRPCGTHGMTAEDTGLHHRPLTGRPRAGGGNGVAGALILGADGFEEGQGVFGAVGGSQREKAVVGIGEGAASANRDHPWITDLRQDHRNLPDADGSCR